jgi:predicted AlkP superfamily phosphohydrolase/phosphomutase
MSRKRVILIGIDGASFKIIDPLIEKGELPAFALLKKEAMWGVLRSNVHPITPSAWASVATGLNPGRHGIFDFRRRRPESYEMRIVDARDRAGQTFWGVLSRLGKRVMVANVPLTYPPEAVNGVLISGMDTPHKDYQYTYPVRLNEEWGGRLDDYIIDVEKEYADEAEYVQAINDMLEGRIRLFSYIMEESNDTDFIFLVFVETDRLQHVFWKYADNAAGLSQDANAAKYRSVISDCYRKIDRFIGTYCMNECDTLALVSDHGFGPLHKDVYLNAWLAKEGFLSFQKRAVPNNSINFLDNINWSKTKAYSCGFFGSIYLNKFGREPLGIVRGEREEKDVLGRISRQLKALKDPDDGKAVVDEVYYQGQLYKGDFTHLAPDLLVKMRDYSYVTRDGYESMDSRIFNTPMAYHPSKVKHSGIHRLEGIFLMRGEGVPAGMQLKEAALCDVFPTLLSRFGYAADWTDGRNLLQSGEK